MTISIIPTAQRFATDSTLYLTNIAIAKNRASARKLELPLLTRVSGIALAALGAVTATSAFSALSVASLSFLPLAGLSAALLVGGHDLVKIGDNISREINPKRYMGNFIKHDIHVLIKRIPPAFVDTLISYDTYNRIFKSLNSIKNTFGFPNYS